MNHTYLPTSRRPAAACLLALGALLAWQPVHAQGYTGLALSNYAGTNAAYVNPSAIADSRHRAYLQLGGAGLSVANSYMRFNLASSPWEKGFELKRSNLVEQGTGGPHTASAALEVRLPALLLTLGPRSAVAVSSRVRGLAQARDVSDNLAKLALFGLGQAQRLELANQLLTDDRLELDVNAYHEFALTYARTLTPNARHFWKAGLTLKYLVGLGAGYVRNEGTQYRVYGRDSLQLQSRQLSYGLTDYRLYGQAGFKAGDLYGSQQLGSGYGADLGLTYEWRPDYDGFEPELDGRPQPDPGQNKYRLRLGLALTDLGAIAYGNDQHVRQGELANTGTKQLGHLDTLRFRTLQQTENTLRRLTGLSSEGRRFTSYLPAALRLTADYHVAGPLYTGLLWTQSLLPARTIGSHVPGAVALVPRLELRHLELALPLLLSNGYRQASVGAMVRLGPLVVGSDNLGGLLGLKEAAGADVYFGLSLALQRHLPGDKDHDGVSDRRDKCPKKKGTWATSGCPPEPATAAPAPNVPPASPTPADSTIAPAPAAPALAVPAPSAPAIPAEAPVTPVPAPPALPAEPTPRP